MTCKLCGQAITEPKKAWREVLGWERPGKGAGGQSGSSLVLREHTDALAHPECITLTRAKIGIEQTNLLDSEGADST